MSPPVDVHIRAQDLPTLDVPSIVCDIRAIDAWIETVQSVRFMIHNEWLLTSEGVELLKAERKKQFPTRDITPESFPELLPNQASEQDFAFDRTRVYQRIDQKDGPIPLNIQIWNGHEGISYSSGRSGREQYLLNKDPAETMSRALHLPLPNHYFHVPWWLGGINRLGDRRYGSPESYHLAGKHEFHGHDCYVLESTEPFTMYVGVADHRLYGREHRATPRSTLAEQNAIYARMGKQCGCEVRDYQEFNKRLPTLDPDRKATVEAEAKRQIRELTVPYFTFWYDDYQTLSNGQLFPMRLGYCIYPVDESPDDARARRTDGRREMYVKEVIIDQPLPDDLFIMEMKEGVRVTDHRYDPFLTYKYKMHFEPDEWNQILNEANDRAQRLQRREAEMDSILGKPAPDFDQAEWVNSKPLTWADLKGKVVLVDFWAAWCAPCCNDYPKLVDLDKEKDKSGIIIVGIHASGMPADEVRKLMKDFGIEYPVCLDSHPNSSWGGPLFTGFRISSLPQAFVVDRDGKIAAHGSFEQAANAARALAAKP